MKMSDLTDEPDHNMIRHDLKIKNLHAKENRLANALHNLKIAAQSYGELSEGTNQKIFARRGTDLLNASIEYAEARKALDFI